MRRPALLLVPALVVMIGACGSSTKSTTPAPTSTPKNVTTATTATSTTTAPRGTAFSATAFAVPFNVTVDHALTSPPNANSTNLVSWDAAASKENKVRFMVPVELYPPGISTPQAPPKDYLTYLQGQTKNGVEISNSLDITVGGYPAKLMNVTSTVDPSHPDGSLDGSLGCPEKGADRADGCFGPQPELLLRIAVVNVGDNTLLAWARVNDAIPDNAFISMFERMLTTVHFTSKN